MLSKRERAVLVAVLEKCGGKNSCLVTEKELFTAIKDKKNAKSSVADIIECLSCDGYIDAVLSDRRGEKVYCVSLLTRGRGYRRELIQSRRYLAFRAALAIISALITFAVGRLLYIIIK